MLIACVKQGQKYGHEYVRKLQSGIARYLPRSDENVFVCYTDDPVPGVICEPLPIDLPGWWAKIGLFKIDEPLIYFDLDVVITGDLAPLLAWEGVGIIKDWWQPGFNSSVMKLTGNEREIYDNFQPEIMNVMHGDQDFITRMMPEAQTFPAHWFPSYKADKCQEAIPEKSIAVIFHGYPKPPNCNGWVEEQWR